MGSALWTGISGLNASSKELDVIANNLANTNTVGFKSGTTYFADVLSQSISGGASGTMQVGRGVSVTEIQTQFSTGSFESTGVATDVAIDGDGFFVVNDADGASYYTRAGAFRLNSEGLLMDTNGYTVQGQMIVNGTPTGALGDIALADVQSEPQVTSTFSIGANLNSETEDSGQYNTSQTVYDSLGGKHTLNTTFTKAGTDTTSSFWAVGSSLDSTAATSLPINGFTFDGDGNMTGTYIGQGTAGAGAASVAVSRPGMIYQDTAVGGMTLTCDATHWYFNLAADKGGYTNATILNPTTLAGPVQISLDGTGTQDITVTPSVLIGNTTAKLTLNNTASAGISDISIGFSTAALGGGATIGSGGTVVWNMAGVDALDITQYASASVVRSLSSDGYSSGSLKSLSIDSDGVISGFFTNGQTTELAQLMLAKFTSPWGLQKMGDNLFGETLSSGAAVINYAGQGGIGSLTSNSLEMSNTDIATEFIKMITAQKAYQANAKVVTTESDMMQVLMNIKQ
ncbi:MAG: flagellar hook protein FlgE [Syntrophaceae bacterium]|nr:flagellar hook protein FlgE [Syntrophaceae bacterium]